MSRRGGIRQASRRRRVYAELAERDGDRCFYCGCDFTGTSKRTRTLDHIVPLHFGGTNQVENLRLACARCNRMKAGRDAEAFLVSRFLRQRREAIERERKRAVASGHESPEERVG